MAGRVQWEAQIDSNVARLLSDAKELREELGGIKKESNNLKINIDTGKLEKIISTLDKLHTSFDGKIHFDYGNLDELSNRIRQISDELSDLKRNLSENTVDITWLNNYTTSLGDDLVDLEAKLDNFIKKIDSNREVSIIDEKSLNSIINLFAKMESHLDEIKKVFTDVGDGEEFSPLLKMINDVQDSIKELSTSVSGIKLDVNMDLGSEINERMNQKVSQTMNRQLEAYRNLFTAMKSTGKTNKEMLRFFEPDDASISEIIGAYKGMIKRAEEQFGKDVYKSKIGKDAYSAYVKEIKNATDQFNRATNKKNTENPLGDLFGKNELIEVVSQLGLIADRLSEISSTVSSLGNTFKNVFKEGFNVSASIEEIEKLTSRVKELEDELSKVKVSSTSPVETNISSPIKDTFQGDVKTSAKSSAPAIKDEAKVMEQVAENAEKASKGKNEFAKANKKVKESADSSSKAVSEEASEFNKIIGKLDGYNTKLANFTVKPADGNRYPIYQKNIDDLTEKINKLQVLSEKDINLINTNDVEDAKTLQKQIDELIFKMSKMSASEKGFDPLGADKALEKIYNELQKNSGMSKEAKLQIQGYYDEIRSGNPSKPIKDLLDDMYKLIQLEREAGRAHKSFKDIFKEKVVYGAAANMAGMIGIYDIINVGRQAVDIVIDLNTQITELAKVSEDSMSQIYDDFNSYAEIAKDIGGTISDTISATSDWSRNGYSIPDSKELAKVALLYKNVGDGIDIGTANESLISTLRGFRMEAEDAMHIIDVFNEVDTLASYYSNVMALCGNT